MRRLLITWNVWLIHSPRKGIIGCSSFREYLRLIWGATGGLIRVTCFGCPLLMWSELHGGDCFMIAIFWIWHWWLQRLLIYFQMVASRIWNDVGTIPCWGGRSNQITRCGSWFKVLKSPSIMSQRWSLGHFQLNLVIIEAPLKHIGPKIFGPASMQPL